MDHFIWSMAWEIWSEVYLKHFRHQQNIYLNSMESIWGQKGGLKRPISVSYELNLAIIVLYRLGNSLEGLFSWSISWEMWSEADLKHFILQKNTFLGSRKSIWGPKSPISVIYELNFAI